MNQRHLFFAALVAVLVGCGAPKDESATPAPAGSEAAVEQAAPEVDATVAAQGTEAPAAAEAAGSEAPKPDPAKPDANKPDAAKPPAGAPPSASGMRAEQPQRGGGPGGGQGGGRGGGRGFNAGMLLRSDQFKKELGITEEQAKKIEAALPAQGQGQPQGGQNVSPEERQKQREELQKKVEALMKPEQIQRMKQIELQMQGPRALTREVVAKDLGLSADQVKKIGAALQVQRPQGGPGAAPGGSGAAPGGQGGPGGPGGAFDRETFMKAREEANKKALAVLTADQKAKWEKMLGKPFVFQRPQGGGGGGIR